MSDFIIALACISFLTLVMGIIYEKIKQSFLSEPIIALAAGVLLGPEILNVLNMHAWGSFDKILEAACLLTMGMALMATAFRIPQHYVFRHVRLQTVLIIFGMIGMCVVSSILIHYILGFGWLLSFLVGAIITPTDPVVASTVVAGETAKKLLPDRVRYAISFESGANDGLALPLVFLALLLTQEAEGVWSEWIIRAVVWDTVAGVAFGFTIGYLAGRILIRARDAGWMSETALLGFSLSLGFFVLGFLELLNSNGILGAFAAGVAANLTLDKSEDIEQEKIQEMLGRIFTIPIFFLFGLVLPWQDWQELGWKAVWIIVAILLLRRLPVIFALKPFLKELSKTADLVMVGWFGPIGVAAIYYMAYSYSLTGNYDVWVVGSLIVFGSTFVHGLTSYPFVRFYSKWEERSGELADKVNL